MLPDLMRGSIRFGHSSCDLKFIDRCEHFHLILQHRLQQRFEFQIYPGARSSDQLGARESALGNRWPQM